MNTEYLEPSLQSRRRLVLIFVFALIIGVVILEALEAALDRSKALPLCDQINTFHLLWAIACGGLMAVGIYAARLAQRSLKLNQWPLPGTSVFRRTLIHRGGSAKWRAYALLVWSVVAVVGSAWSWYAAENYVSRVEVQRCVEK